MRQKLLLIILLLFGLYLAPPSHNVEATEPEYFKIPFTTIVNARLSATRISSDGSSAFPFSDNLILGTAYIPFSIPTDSSGQNNYFNSYYNEYARITTSIANPLVAYFLFAGGGTSASVNPPRKFGEIKINFDDNTNLRTDLTEQINLREWILDYPTSVHTLSNGAVEEVWRGMSPTGNGPTIVDMITIPIPPSFQNKIISSVEFIDTIPGLPGIHLLGGTVKKLATPVSPPPPNPVIFVPGFGGSWSYKGLIENQPTTYADWSLTPYFTDGFYQPLITTLKNAGVEPLIFAYDFRKSVANSAAILNTYLTDKIPTGKANVVAHSMGGLVVRYCFEKVPGCADKIDKIITAGSPHQGTLKAYPLWEAGDFGNLDLPTKTAVEIALRSNSFPYLTDKDIIQNKFPGVRDLLPVSNPPSGSISDNFTAFSGIGTPTWSTFTTITRNSLDRALGLWIDGKPGIYSTDDGDDTVLKTSSRLGAKTNYYSLRHGDYFQNTASLSDLLTLFGLPTNNIVTTVTKPTSILAFIVHSPVTLSVAGQTGKAIFISNPTTQNYQITLTGTGNGSYQLDSFFVKDNLVVNKTFNGLITNNATQTVNFNFSPDPGQNFNDNDASQLLSSVRQKIIQSSIRNLKIIDVTVTQAFNDIRLNRNRTAAFNNLEKSLVDTWKLLAAENKAENRQEITQVANQLISLTVRLNQLYRLEISVTNANTEIARSQKSLDTKAALPSLSLREAANLSLATKNLLSAQGLVSVGKNYQALLIARSILSLVN